MDKPGVIILAGGYSSRFGIPKPFLKFSAAITFLEKLVYEYEKFSCDNIVLVLNSSLLNYYTESYSKEFRNKIKLVTNSKPELGRFYSIKLGIEKIEDADHCFIQNIDNPFTDIETLALIYNCRKEDSYVSPYFGDKGGHPVLISKKIIESIKQETNLEINTKDFLCRFNKIKIEVPNNKILANINTSVEYSQFF